MRKLLRIMGTTVALSLGVILVATSASLASATTTTKPARDYVSAGAKVISFSSSAITVGASNNTAPKIITNPRVIAEVRAFINSLPLSNTSKEFCPDDLMIPAWVSFSTSTTALPFARVEFQLGGCPFARVYQHSAAELPTLGGPHLGTVYAKIKSLFDVSN